MNLAFITILAVVLLLGAIVYYTQLKSERKALAKFHIKNHFQSTEFDALLMGLAEATKSNKYNKESWYPKDGWVSMDAFLEQLMAKGFKIEVQSTACNMDRTACSTVCKVTKDNATVFFNAEYSEVSMYDSNKVIRYESDTIVVEDYMVNGGQMSIGRNLNWAFPIDKVEFMDEIKQVYSDSLLKWITIEEPKEEVISFYKVVKQAKTLTLAYCESEVSPLSKKMVDASYENFNFVYGNKEYNVDPLGMLRIVSETLITGGNVFMRGMYGVAKTTFMHTVMKALANQYKNVMCIYLDAGIIGELNELENQYAFESAILEYKSRGTKVVICIDEAEELMVSDNGIHTAQNSWLLKLTDGELKKRLNCSTILIYNSDKKNLNPAFFRDMRCAYELEFLPLTTDKAHRMVSELKKRLKDSSFDEAKYMHTLHTIQYASDGSVSTPAGRITQAQLVACFVPKSLNDTIHAVINKTLIEIGAEQGPKTESLPSKVSDWDEDDELPVTPIALAPKPTVGHSAPVIGMNRKDKRKNKGKKPHQNPSLRTLLDNKTNIRPEA